MIITKLLTLTFFLTACQAIPGSTKIRREGQSQKRDVSSLVAAILEDPDFQKSVNTAVNAEQRKMATAKKLNEERELNVIPVEIDVKYNSIENSQRNKIEPTNQPNSVNVNAFPTGANQALPLYPPQGIANGHYNDNPVINIAQAADSGYSVLTSQVVSTLYNEPSDTGVGGIGDTTGIPGPLVTSETSEYYGTWAGDFGTPTLSEPYRVGATETSAEYNTEFANTEYTGYDTNYDYGTSYVTNSGGIISATDLATDTAAATTASSYTAESSETAAAAGPDATAESTSFPPQSNGQNKIAVGAILGLMIVVTMALFME